MVLIVFSSNSAVKYLVTSLIGILDLPVFPNFKIRFFVQMLNKKRNVYKFLGQAYHEETLVSESEFSAMITDSNIL